MDGSVSKGFSSVNRKRLRSNNTESQKHSQPHTGVACGIAAPLMRDDPHSLSEARVKWQPDFFAADVRGGYVMIVAAPAWRGVLPVPVAVPTAPRIPRISRIPRDKKEGLTPRMQSFRRVSLLWT